MSNNTPDYNNDLVFAPTGDWADTNPRTNTDRTDSSIEMVNRIEALTLDNDRKSRHLVELAGTVDILEKEIGWLKVLLSTCRDIIKHERIEAKYTNLFAKIEKALK